eukprot:g4084.t1
MTPGELFKICADNIANKNVVNNAYIKIFSSHTIDEAVNKSNENINNGCARPLEGLTIAIKDNFCVEGHNTTAGSKMLENFIAPYNASIVNSLKENGAILMGKTNMDEFGMGSYNIHSFFGPVRNPLDLNRCAGGSSGGSAAAVASNTCAVAIGSDTGGSIRLPAAYCGVVGIKPAYGHVSRWGLIPYANSLDTPGVLCKHLIDGMEVLNCIDGFDEKDSTSAACIGNGNDRNDNHKHILYSYLELLEQEDKKEQANINCLQGINIGIPNEFYVEELPASILKTWKDAIKKLNAYGANIVEISLPTVKHALPAYYIIALAEAASNLAKYDGVRYGYRDENDPPDGVYTSTRTVAFGNAVQERIMMGNLVLGADSRQLYEHASKTRNTLVNEFDDVFSNKCDILLSPTSCNLAPLIEDLVKDNYTANTDPTLEYTDDVFTIPASLVGIPSFAIPIYNHDNNSNHQGNLPHSLQVMGPAIVNRDGDDNYNVGGGIGVKQLKVALALEKWGTK